MLKIIANVLLFLFIAFNAYAGGGAVGLMVAASGSAAVAACTTPDSNATGGTNGTLGHSAPYEKIAASWTASSGYTDKSITISLLRVGDPNSVGFTTITPYICTDNAAKPSSTCQALDSTIATSTLTTSAADYCISITAGYSISNATRYWLKLEGNALGNASNYVRLNYYNTGTEMVANWNGSSWVNTDSSALFKYSTSTCVCP